MQTVDAHGRKLLIPEPPVDDVMRKIAEVLRGRPRWQLLAGRGVVLAVLSKEPGGDLPPSN